MWSLKELLEQEVPYLSFDDITKEDWEALDIELDKYDSNGKPYDPDECKVLSFVLQQIHYEPMNFNKVPNFIRNGREFQRLAVQYNKSLEPILFPEKKSNEIH